MVMGWPGADLRGYFGTFARAVLADDRLRASRFLAALISSNVVCKDYHFLSPSTVGNRMNYSEMVSKGVLEKVLPGAILNFRLIQSHGEYDFDMRCPDGTAAAVEVTAAVDEILMNTVGAIRGKRAGGSVLKAVACKKSWVVFPAKGASIPSIRTEIDRALAELEREGIEGFSWVSRGSPSVREICSRLQITGGGVLSSEGEPTIRIAFPIGGGAVGPSLAIRVGEIEAWKDDNRRKLGAAITPERHLVVYVDPSNGLPWTALTSFTPPSCLPNLPAEITTLWLIGQIEGRGECVVWHANTRSAWSSKKVAF